MAEDGTKQEKKEKKKGGVRTMPFILANEFCDKFATSGFNANMITYLTEQLHLPLVDASNTLTNFGGTASLTPIIGALIADSFAGRFWTIVAGLIVYKLGMIILTVSAVIPSLRPPQCPSQSVLCQHADATQLAIMYVSLFFTSLGTGGLRPNLVAFGADQFGLDGPRATARQAKFFNLYFFSFGLAVLLALTVVVYIQENVGWGWGFGIPAISMAVALVVFVVGYPLYVRVKPGGSPLTRVTQVIVAAVKKRKEVNPEDSALLYQDKKLDADISTFGRLLHTDQLKFLDRAAIVTKGDMTDAGEPRLWRLATVHRVEELKSVIRMIPLWSVGILLVTAVSHNHTFTIQQARTMDRHLSPTFQIPPATISIFSSIAMLLTLGFYDRVFVPVARRFTGNPSGITYFTRMGVGLFIGILGNAAGAFVETKRRAAAVDNGLLDDPKAVVPISVFWLVPQYAIHGISDAFSTVGHMEFLYDQSPESMRSTAAALFWLAISAGNYLGTLLVTLVHDITKQQDQDWLPDNLNRGKLDLYYWLVTAIQVFNLGYYIICVKFYTVKPLELATAEEEVAEDGDHQKDQDAELELIASVKRDRTNKHDGGNHIV